MFCSGGYLVAGHNGPGNGGRRAALSARDPAQGKVFLLVNWFFLQVLDDLSFDRLRPNQASNIYVSHVLYQNIQKKIFSDI